MDEGVAVDLASADGDECLGDRGPVGLGHQGIALGDLGGRTPVDGHDGGAHRHPLEGRQAEALVDARHDDGFGGGHDLTDPVEVDLAREDHTRQVPEELFAAAVEWAEEHELVVGQLRRSLGPRLGQAFEVLAAGDTRGVDEEGPRDSEVAQVLRRQGSRLAEARPDPVGDDRHVAGSEQLSHLAGGELRRADHLHIVTQGRHAPRRQAPLIGEACRRQVVHRENVGASWARDPQVEAVDEVMPQRQGGTDDGSAAGMVQDAVGHPERGLAAPSAHARRAEVPAWLVEVEDRPLDARLVGLLPHGDGCVEGQPMDPSCPCIPRGRTRPCAMRPRHGRHSSATEPSARRSGSHLRRAGRDAQLTATAGAPVLCSVCGAIRARLPE